MEVLLNTLRAVGTVLLFVGILFGGGKLVQKATMAPMGWLVRGCMKDFWFHLQGIMPGNFEVNKIIYSKAPTFLSRFSPYRHFVIVTPDDECLSLDVIARNMKHDSKWIARGLGVWGLDGWRKNFHQNDIDVLEWLRDNCEGKFEFLFTEMGCRPSPNRFIVSQRDILISLSSPADFLKVRLVFNVVVPAEQNW